ncbi:MAG: hypothetical protein ABI947_19225 [Chloroflexota bacterium]
MSEELEIKRMVARLIDLAKLLAEVEQQDNTKLVQPCQSILDRPLTKPAVEKKESPQPKSGTR